MYAITVNEIHVTRKNANKAIMGDSTDGQVRNKGSAMLKKNNGPMSIK